MPKDEESLEENIQSDIVETNTDVSQDETEKSEIIEGDALSENLVEEFKPEQINSVDDVENDDLSESVSHDEPVMVKPVKFTSFEDTNQAIGEVNKNLDILMDIKLQLTVELGRTEMPVKKVLELTRGSIVELEKVAGEPVELYANGKLVAQGEVVVIEDNFGLRITSITDPEDRLKGI